MKFEISIFLPPFYLSCFFFAESHHDLTQPTSTLHGGEIFFFILFSFMTTAKLHGVVFQFPCPKLAPNFKLRSVKNFAAEIDPIYQFCGYFNLWEHYRFSALFTFFSPFWLFFRNFTFSLLSTYFCPPPLTFVGGGETKWKRQKCIYNRSDHSFFTS